MERCARPAKRGRGERIKASQRNKFEAAAEKIRSKRKCKNLKEQNLNGALVATSSDCLLADECATKKRQSVKYWLQIKYTDFYI